MKTGNHVILSILTLSLCFTCGCGPQSPGKPEPPAATPTLEQPTEEPTKASIVKFMVSKNELGIDERIALYHQLKRESPSVYNFDEEKELNQYGYSLLFAKKPEEAIKIFKLLIAEFPNDSNPYDSLAEAYQRQDNKEEAIINYEKSVAIDPGNTRAKFQIKVLKGVLDILDSDWGKEIFEVPVRFAPDMTLVGFEDVRFTKGWGKKDSDELWSYVFAWKVEHKALLSEEVLEKNLVVYFDGLLSRDKEKDAPPKATLKRIAESEGVVKLEGTVDFMDTRLTKGRLVLNIRAESRLCAEQGKAVVSFWFSPKPLDHAIWAKLRTVKVLSDICSR